MTDKVPVAVFGATGMVGQQLLLLLENHPWFHATVLVASERNAGKPYGDAVQWSMEEPMPPSIAGMEIKGPRARIRAPLVFSCLGAMVARKIEPALAERGHLVVSNASAFRHSPDVPLLIPEVNPGSLALLSRQRTLGGPGVIVTNPNCVVAGLALGLAPLHRAFIIRKVVVSTLQAISGAGLPGPASLEMVDNLIPWISGEEEKIASETKAILGSNMEISVSVHRVAVVHGHTMSVFVETDKSIEPKEAIEAWNTFRAPDIVAELPSAPEQPIRYIHDQARPQPKLDRMNGKGMTVTIGRARQCPVLGFVFELCAHNLIRGAAGAALLNAELCVKQGWIE